MARINGCNHEFCFQCIDKWSETKLECPMCRAKFTTIESGDMIFDCPEVEIDEQEQELHRMVDEMYEEIHERIQYNQ